MHRILEQSAHRPWPMPNGSWVMRQDWCDLLFAHWPVPPEALRELMPPELDLDLFDGEAWVGVVPFRMAGVRFRGTPALPGISAFPELNLRTYVRVGDRPGVWFFSLDATSLLAVKTARRWFNLPYHHARMSCKANGESIEYSSARFDHGEGTPKLRARYRPTGEPALAQAGSLDHWLTERYCLYAERADGSLARGEIHHAPWNLQPAEAEFELEEYSRAQGITLPDEPPLLHFVSQIEVVVWSPRPVLLDLR